MKKLILVLIILLGINTFSEQAIINKENNLERKENEMNYMFIVLVEFYPKWLALPRKVRNEKADELKKIISKYPELKVRFFDAETLPGSNYTDIFVCETKNIEKYHYMWEEIRDNEIYTKEYMKIKDVIMGMEEVYVKYEKDMLKL